MNTTHSKERVIEVRNIFKAFGTHQVLKGVDMDLYSEEKLVILGRSGTGKSVLIRLIIGLLTPDMGSIKVLGKDMLDISHKELHALRTRIGFSFQESALYDSMTVRENLEFPLVRNNRHLTNREVRYEVDEVLESVGLKALARQMPASLSGGQKKRIGIARTLILKPEIMLYDEPTAGLDPLTCTEINSLIIDINQRYRTSSIIITHDLTCAKMVSDRVIMLLDGTFDQEGTFDEVFRSEDPRIKGFYDYNFIQ